MFEKSLEEKLKRIFDLKKVSFDHPSESQEQEGCFVEVEAARTSVKDGREICRVNGKLHIFGNDKKLPYGYFSKKLAKADIQDTQCLFFFNFEENAGQFVNIVERSLSFIYLYDSQYDPAIGTITSINLSMAEN